jgi:hypothetical protein
MIQRIRHRMGKRKDDFVDTNVDLDASSRPTFSEL